MFTFGYKSDNEKGGKSIEYIDGIKGDVAQSKSDSRSKEGKIMCKFWFHI